MKNLEMGGGLRAGRRGPGWRAVSGGCHDGGLFHAIPNSERGRRESTEKRVVQRDILGKERTKRKEKKRNFLSIHL